MSATLFTRRRFVQQAAAALSPTILRVKSGLKFTYANGWITPSRR